MTVEEFDIKVDNPSLNYFPGETVSGQVVLRTNESVKTKGLTILFCGTVFVNFSVYENRAYRNRFSQDNLFCFKTFLVSDEKNSVTIPAGRSSYPFSFQLPAGPLPSTFVHENGHVQCILTATLARSFFSSDDRKEVVIRVNSNLDLNTISGISQPKTWTLCKPFSGCCCTSNGEVTVSATLQKQGYLPSDTIQLVVEFENGSDRELQNVQIKLNQDLTFYAERNIAQCSRAVKTVKYDEIRVPKGKTEIRHFELVIPDSVPPTNLGGCKNIHLEYSCVVEMTRGENFGNLFALQVPITIGTVPLRDS